ncbi:glycosyltransferase family 1 protein [Rubrivirga sp. S365]|uniref:Glycosyltransferase family 1 protein n=1 Tax=Rubrivirga litoralis TaxID=3075598 RepID=A0ABU3BLL5_9BACT|nr:MULTISPECIES: glycosyltransferase family 1 protein [unclassified Rubrivirga]MDT0630182.1 glycosyltransferase family 1 protein [Rubrivirga sp. F394]MDT7855693.1 glycosyltransferase family 1 protein [Rubrivirga sp. S365]
MPTPPDPLRVALFTGNYNHIEDGVSRTLGRLVGYLEEQGHSVLVVGPTVPDPPLTQPGEFVEAPSVPFFNRAEYRLATGFPRSLRARVEAFRPDLVHVASPDVLGHRAVTWGRKHGLPVVSTYHTHFPAYLGYWGPTWLEPVSWAVARGFYGRCNEVYVPTPTLLEELRSHGIQTTFRLWPRGIELDRFSPAYRSDAWRAGRGFEPSDVVVSFVSRLVKEKGIDVYVEVVRRLQASGAPVRALVVGDGPERASLEARLPGAVFTGHLGGVELATAYASSDVFLFPSETETFGNVTLEAMASGLAVVCADAAGSRSLVTDGVTGLLCPPRNADAFEAAVRRLLDRPALRADLGGAARDAAGDYSWPTVLATMEDYYRGVLASTSR